MKISQINEILEGLALLEYIGCLYEYAGMEKEKYIFQSINDDHYIKVSYDSLLTMNEYDIQY